MNSKWNSWIFAGATGILLGIGGFLIGSNPCLTIFLIIAINTLHVFVPAKVC
jgi:hypothetical protein